MSITSAKSKKKWKVDSAPGPTHKKQLVHKTPHSPLVSLQNNIYDVLASTFTEITDAVVSSGDLLQKWNQTNTEFKQKEREADKAIVNMENAACFRSIPQLFTELYSVLQHFVVNQMAAATFYERLFDFAIILAHPKHSILQRSQQASYYGVVLTVTHTTPLAEILSSTIRYLNRYTTQTAYVELLHGKDLSFRLVEIDLKLTSACVKLIDIIEASTLLSFKKEPATYVVMEDVHTQILLRFSDPSQQNAVFHDLNVTEDEDKGNACMHAWVGWLGVVIVIVMGVVIVVAVIDCCWIILFIMHARFKVVFINLFD